MERSTSAEALGNPAEWADRRGSLARSLLKDGDAATAYKVAARHWLAGGADYAELEFLAGFIALRKLNDADTALQHFQRLKAAVVTPISLSRASYWQGRAYEAKGDAAAAKLAYTEAAQNQTAYYGLLAAEKLGLPLDARLIATARPADWRGASFANSSVLEAALLLAKAGDLRQSKRFFLHLAEGLNATELDQLADLALSIKAAAYRGVDRQAGCRARGHPAARLFPGGRDCAGWAGGQPRAGAFDCAAGKRV